jgi:hypothetical protein
MADIKDYLSTENARNRAHHKLYERLMKAATGCDDILIAHHLTFSLPGCEPNEVPSADTLIFCHDMMQKAFGGAYLHVMMSLAVEPNETREELLEKLMDAYHVNESHKTA